MSSRAQKIINGIIAVPFLLLGAALVVALLYLVYCEVNKAYWDNKVREWCEKDGGVTVFEKVELTQGEYKKFVTGNNKYPVFPTESMAKDDDSFYLSYRTSVINDSYPRVDRTETSIVRAVDKKVISTMVNYNRSGGDSIIIDHPSSFSCERNINLFDKFNSSIYYKGE